MGKNEIRSRCEQRSAQRMVLVVMVLVAGATAALAQGKAPVPDAAAQKRAQGLLRDVYGKEYDAAKTSKQKTELAKKLLDQAAKSKADSASHFVLLRVAKEMAVLGADAETALEAVERIVATYDVDAMEMWLACAKRLASAAKFSSQHAALAAQVYALVDIAVAEDNFEAASQLGEIARVAAQRARSYPLLKQIAARMEKLDEVRQAHAEYRKAVARLEESPTDPEANLAAGRYLCLSRSNWNRGIPMLALGSDTALQALAQQVGSGADQRGPRAGFLFASCRPLVRASATEGGLHSDESEAPGSAGGDRQDRAPGRPDRGGQRRQPRASRKRSPRRKHRAIEDAPDALGTGAHSRPLQPGGCTPRETAPGADGHIYFSGVQSGRDGPFHRQRFGTDGGALGDGFGAPSGLNWSIAGVADSGTQIRYANDRT